MEAASIVSGRRPISAPKRAARPSPGSWPRVRDGQNILRPQAASSAGIRVRLPASITRTATAMAGPIERNCPKVATPSVANAATMVSAAEAIAVPTRADTCSAASRALCSGRARSCSRKRNSRNSR